MNIILVFTGKGISLFPAKKGHSHLINLITLIMINNMNDISKNIIKKSGIIVLAIVSIFVSSPTIIRQNEVKANSSLSVDLSAQPSSGTAPLNGVSLTANVSGNSAGSITYKFDCKNDGTWEKIYTTTSNIYTAANLCNYPDPGNYTAKVRVEQGNLSFEGTTAILITSGNSLFVELSAQPSSGEAPLNGVSLTAEVSGTATGPITYRFDCADDGSWEKIYTTNSEIYTAANLCNYPSAGNYTAVVRVERQNLSFQGTAPILVTQPAPKTLFVDLTANPSSGTEPLNGVDLTATVSGTATGPITYKFDCASDGSWEKTITTSSNPYTAFDLCNYSAEGTYTAKVQATRENLTAEDTAQIQVEAGAKTLHVSISATPSSGHAPLDNVDLAAEVSGTATGPITYKFDCQNDGSWEFQTTTNSTSYTAQGLCDYPNPGTYTFRVYAQRNNLQVQGTGNIVVGETANLAMEFIADPSFGQGTLLDVDLTVYVSGSATGSITYSFDCTSNGTWEKTVSTNNNSYTAVDLCDYSSPGVYTAKAKVERGGIVIVGTTVIFVSSD